jgi:hypothetical protein
MGDRVTAATVQADLNEVVGTVNSHSEELAKLRALPDEIRELKGLVDTTARPAPLDATAVAGNLRSSIAMVDQIIGQLEGLIAEYGKVRSEMEKGALLLDRLADLRRAQELLDRPEPTVLDLRG